MRGLSLPCWKLAPWVLAFCFLTTTLAHAQRLTLPPQSTPFTPLETTNQSITQPEKSGTQILKTYPDGTKKIVPLEGLNYRDDGAAYGGPPGLTVYTPLPALSSQSPERLTISPIGVEGQSVSLNTPVPASVDPLAGATQVAAGDPMGGGTATDPMGGGGASSAPIDPLGGGAPPLQTVSGKPAPIVGDTTMLQLGAWDSFFLNAGIGGSLQGQLTARRIWNGNNRQAYPYVAPPSAGPLSGENISGENFTFNPGFRLDVEFGYNFYEWLGVGLQTGMTYNGINQYNVTFTDGASFHNSADGELVQVPVQINGILRWPGQVKFRPFIGGGVGAVWQQLDVNNYYYLDQDIQGNYCRSGFQFGWNAQVGATYTVEPGLDFYGAFKMLSAFMPVIGNYQFENSYNFAVEIGIQSRF